MVRARLFDTPPDIEAGTARQPGAFTAVGEALTGLSRGLRGQAPIDNAGRRFQEFLQLQQMQMAQEEQSLRQQRFDFDKQEFDFKKDQILEEQKFREFDQLAKIRSAGLQQVPEGFTPQQGQQVFDAGAAGQFVESPEVAFERDRDLIGQGFERIDSGVNLTLDRFNQFIKDIKQGRRQIIETPDGKAFVSPLPQEKGVTPKQALENVKSQKTLNAIEKISSGQPLSQVEKAAFNKEFGLDDAKFSDEFKESIDIGLDSVTQGADPTKVFQQLSTIYPEHSATLKRIFVTKTTLDIEGLIDSL